MSRPWYLRDNTYIYCNQPVHLYEHVIKVNYELYISPNEYQTQIVDHSIVL